MEELNPYMVEFNEDGAIKVKDYPSNCIIGDKERRPIIIINYNEYTFFTNDGVRKV